MAKNARHFFRDGREHKGATHRMNGELHSGKKHTAASQVLVHKAALSAAAKKKAGK